jgi:hypothetical protein
VCVCVLEGVGWDGYACGALIDVLWWLVDYVTVSEWSL